MYRSFIFMFLMFLLPLQASWGSVADYCAHGELPQQTAHFGHHQDEHHSHAWQMDGDENQDSQYPQHHDHSHSSSFVGFSADDAHSVVIDFSSPQQVLSTSKYSFFCQTRPERPKWPVSA
jgi:hypothetical protein